MIDNRAIRRSAALLGVILTLILAATGGCRGGDEREQGAQRSAQTQATTDQPATAAARPPDFVFRSLEPEAVVKLKGEGAGYVAVTSDAVWVPTSAGLFRIDPDTNKATRVLAKPAFAVTADDGGVWVPSFEEDVVRRVDPKSGNVVATVEVGKAPEGVTRTPDAVWVANHHGGSVTRLDPSTNKVVATVDVADKGSSGPQGIAEGAESVWVGVPNANAVFRINPAENTVIAKIPVELPAVPCGGFAIDESTAWLTSCAETTFLSRIDVHANRLAALLDMGAYGGVPFFVDGDLWVPVFPEAPSPGGLVRVDMDANRFVDGIGLGDDFLAWGTAVAFESVWVTDVEGARVARIPLAALSAGQ